MLQDGDTFLRQAKLTCEEAGNRLRIEPVTTTVRLLAQSFSRDHAYLAIELPDRKCYGFSCPKCSYLTTALPFSIPGVTRRDQGIERELRHLVRVSPSESQVPWGVGADRRGRESKRWYSHEGHHCATLHFQ